MFFTRGGRNQPGFAGAFVEGLVADAIFAHIRMKNADLKVGRTVKNETEWEIYTEVLARFLGVNSTDLRHKLIEERTNCRDLRLCANRIFFWAYSNTHPW